MPTWPQPLELSRVLTRAGSLRFTCEILNSQPPTAEVGALTFRRRGSRGPRALVYVGPLEKEAYERIRDLNDTAFVVRIFRDPRELLMGPVATAETSQDG